MEVDFKKYKDGLVPAVIQDAETRNVLMLGFMNEEALKTTLESERVTFFSRSKNRLWTKGETSKNFLNLVAHSVDCDGDTLLFQVIPEGPTCHLGTDTCWGSENEASFGFLSTLEAVIEDRKQNIDSEDSYTASLFRNGINKIAQKVGEEAVEVVIEAKDDDPVAFLNESADLLYHFMILLEAKNFKLKDVTEVLRARHSE